MSARLILAVVLLVPALSACQRTGPLAPVTNVSQIPESAGGAVVVARGDTLYTLSRRYNVPLRDLMEVNRLSPPYAIEPGQRLVLPASRQYVVQKGDTLYGISRMFNVEVTELSRLNSLAAPYAVKTGQPLRLPGGGQRTVETAQAGGAAPPVPLVGPPPS
ncbi:MAG TPA: LysM domain-containing protein, partial [Azospirillum sp.]